MAQLTKSKVTVSAEAGAAGTGTDFYTIIAPVPVSPDGVPRLFASGKQVFDQHGYSPGCEFASLYADEVGKPFIFVGVPIATQGSLGQLNTVGNTGTSTVSVTAGTNGPLEETNGIVKVLAGGTIGASQILLSLSLDGGSKYKTVRLGTANTYTTQYSSITISFGAGTLVTGDTIATWKTTAPICDTAGVTLARQSLAGQQKLSKKWIVISDAPDLTFANGVLAQCLTYETANERFQGVRVQVRDHIAQAVMAKTSLSVAAQMTFAEVGGTGDTVTRTGGSFLSDGVVVGDIPTISGTVSNNVTGVDKITAVTATVLTLGTDDLTPESNVTTARIVFWGSLTFSLAGRTVTRNRGSWIDDGFRVGQVATMTGNGNANDQSAQILTVTHTVITFVTGTVLVDSVKSTQSVSVTVGETKAQWVTSIESAFSTVDSAPRINLGAGRARKLSPMTDWNYRRPVQWAAAIREMQHDVHVPTWKKDLGSLPGWSLLDSAQQLVEYDDRIDGAGLSAARFTSFRSWANGPSGTFISLDLTRDVDGGRLSYAHNQDVVNLVQTLVHSATEYLIGNTPQLNPDGTAMKDELADIKERVNAPLRREMYKNLGEGNRCSFVEWAPNTTDDLSVPGAVLTGISELSLNGIIHSTNTVIKVR